jgi:hypothetical protein
MIYALLLRVRTKSGIQHHAFTLPDFYIPYPLAALCGCSIRGTAPRVRIAQAVNGYAVDE